MLGNLTTDSKKQQLEIQDLKERLLSEETISTFEKNQTLSEKIEEVKLMLEATSTSNRILSSMILANKNVFFCII